MSDIILSIGMIVKNEIRCLEKCLKALEPLRQRIPSELVIADTGSTDGTREIAARYADIFFDIPWKNDFSAARNAVLARCSGQWYFSVDADEYLDENIEELVQFLMGSSAQGQEEDYAFVTSSNFTDQTLDKETAASFLALRLAKIHPDLKFVGKVHEHFNWQESDIMISLSGTVLWHDGYAYESKEQARKKQQRNMQLLEQELLENPDDPLRIVQCVESSRNMEERLQYIERGLQQIASGAPNWDQQGPALLYYALEWASKAGSSKVQEWAQFAYDRYPDSPLTQIDINAVMAGYYRKCYEWQRALEAADAYWEGIQKMDRGEFQTAIFVTVMVSLNTQGAREYMALLQAEACYHLNRPKLAMQVLQKIPLKTIGGVHVAGLMGLLAKLAKKIDVSKYFCADAQKILTEKPESREDWRRQDALRQALSGVFIPSDQYELPAKLLQQLGDDVFAPAASIMASEQPAELQSIAGSITSWKHIPMPVVQKLVEAGIDLPEAFFHTTDFEDICGITEYLVKHMDNAAEQVLRIVEHLEASDARMATWRFELLIQACAWFKWKNDKVAEQLLNALCKATETYLTMVYPADLLQSEYLHAVLPQNCRFAYGCLQAEQQLQADEQTACVQTLKELLDLAPAMREMILFMTQRVGRVTEERRVRAGITPELIAMAKQVRAMLSQYPENSPMVFLLKSSEQYQKMKFLIEDPNLDNMG